MIFEFQQYIEARKSLPKRGKKVLTPNGEGKVVDVFPLKDAVLVDFGNSVTYEFEREELEPSKELKALKKKTKEKCGDKGGDDCECRKEKNDN